MKKFLSFFILLAVGLLYTGCEDALDINEDPLAATVADPDLLYPEVLVNFSNNRTIEVSGRMGNVVQYYEPALTVFGDMALGELGNTFLVGNVWANYYTTGLKNLTLAIQDAEAQDPPNNNVIAQSKILQAFIFYNLTNLWEEVPFSQAVDFDVSEPTFDDGESIIRGIITMLDEALNLVDADPETFRVTAGDLIYGGDMEAWTKFANSLKLKCMMLIANKDQSIAGELNKVVQEPLVTTLADEAEFQYFDNPGDFNPIWNTLNRFAGGINPTWYVASTTFMDVMNDLNDPRKSLYYDESDDPATVGTGAFGPAASPGSYDGASGNAIVSLNILRPDFPDRYMTSAEVVLLHAEAIARGWVDGTIADADAKYREGIQLAMDYYDGKPGALDAQAKTDYLASLPDLGTLSAEEAVEAIHIQLYIQNFFRIPEGWIQWKRTKVPDLEVPQGSQLSDILRRLFYPPDEKGANPNTPADKPLDQPMWYEN
jgi:hypothetical protein